MVLLSTLKINPCNAESSVSIYKSFETGIANGVFQIQITEILTKEIHHEVGT